MINHFFPRYVCVFYISYLYNIVLVIFHFLICLYFRYEVLLERAQTRRSRLHTALGLAEEWFHLATPLSIWLDATEKAVHQLGKVPVNEEIMQQQIKAHQVQF